MTFSKPLLASVCLLVHTLSWSTAFAWSQPESTRSQRASGPLSQVDRYARRCQGYTTHQGIHPPGSSLWGTRQTWDELQPSTDEWRSVLVSVDLSSPRISNPEVKGLQLEKGRLVALPRSSSSLVGTVLQGASSNGRPVEVALCGAEPAPEDPDMAWYRIEAWNPVTQEWENPCVATGHVPDPRALAISGVWDSNGAQQQVPGRLTLACENGAIAQCIRWGYKPWVSVRGQSLADLHQACTRMVRADYCGNGRSHLPEPGTIIDMYDSIGLQNPTTQAWNGWDPARASFEAAWAPGGAVCLSRPRDGRALEAIQQECPGRFVMGAPVNPSPEDHCILQRSGVEPKTASLKNRVLNDAWLAQPTN